MNFHDHGARWSFNAIGQWLSRDPLAELDLWNSAYSYCKNNPVNYRDPDGRMAVTDDYGLDENTGRLSLLEKTDDNFDLIKTGSFDLSGKFTETSGGALYAASKGILNATNTGVDLSKAGFNATNGQEGIGLAKFISFNSNKELSGFGYLDNGNEGVSVSRWDKNTVRTAGTYPSDIDNIKGTINFYFHTHPSGRSGNLGTGTSSIADKNAARFFEMLGIYKNYIISQKEGVVQYSPHGQISPFVGAPLPKSLLQKRLSPFGFGR